MSNAWRALMMSEAKYRTRDRGKVRWLIDSLIETVVIVGEATPTA
jgi:hypothetical protein